MAVGTKIFFDMMNKQPSKVLVFGDACSDVTAAIADHARQLQVRPETDPDYLCNSPGIIRF